MKIKISTAVPPALIAALSKSNLRFTSLVTIYHCIQLGSNHWVGTAGDGDNGSYEWFVYNDGYLEISDCGFGTPEYALKEVLVKEVE